MLRLEDYSKDLRRHLEAVFAFCGMRPPTEAEWTVIIGAPRANTRAGAGRKMLSDDAGGDMLPATRDKLRAFYAPFNAKLAALLGDARFAWEATV